MLPNRPKVNQQHGYIHADATSAIADSAGGYAAFTLFPENTEVLTVEYKINFVAPAVGDHIEAVGTVIKSGRTLTVCQLEVCAFQGPKRSLVAAGQQTLICVPEEIRTVTTISRAATNQPDHPRRNPTTPRRNRNATCTAPRRLPRPHHTARR